MSFNSTLVLAANDGVRPPRLGEFRDLLVEHGLVDPSDDRDPADFRRTPVVTELFRDPVAEGENDRFFRPNGIRLIAELEVNGPDGTYVGSACGVEFYGYGYFWPWGLTELRDRVARAPQMVLLRAAVAERLGGQFVIPAADEELLRTRVVDGLGGWTWFASEDVY